MAAIDACLAESATRLASGAMTRWNSCWVPVANVACRGHYRDDASLHRGCWANAASVGIVDRRDAPYRAWASVVISGAMAVTVAVISVNENGYASAGNAIGRSAVADDQAAVRWVGNDYTEALPRVRHDHHGRLVLPEDQPHDHFHQSCSPPGCTSSCSRCGANGWGPSPRPRSASCPNSRWLCWHEPFS